MSLLQVRRFSVVAIRRGLIIVAVLLAGRCSFVSAEEGFRVGYAEQDVTPPPGLPMWGYGARHALTAQGAMQPLMARAVVIQAGEDKLAIVGTDLGRGPTSPMMEQIRETLAEQAGIKHVLISGSHSHHGPVIELTDRVGFGKGTFDKAVTYAHDLPNLLIKVILAADEAAVPAKLGISDRTDLTLNRNRHSKREPKARDPMLAVMRFDDEQGHPIAVIANFAAHPTMEDGKDLRYSPDYPGYLCAKVKDHLDAGCVFMQGAAGDMSVSPPEGHRSPQQFGELLADHVLELTAGTETTVPEKPSIAGKVDSFVFRSRINFDDPLVMLAFSAAFFPELAMNAIEEFKQGLRAELNTVVLNGNVALVGASGEFFCNHANRLKERSYVDHTLFFGYCNGHSMYFPTIEAVSEGGYGADAPVSPVEIGAGEQMINTALMNLYTLLGKMEPSATFGPKAAEAGATP
ncbi:MAG: neutral/alkaline non-lysosomal ceramidase N-terminal domain-containing protein [Planctomycetaceae bacterium]|nr:neutral/alkaline non-lysosomal ceramidase N-terminal domain-containing protein [Planctomycetaceae bacterium]